MHTHTHTHTRVQYGPVYETVLGNGAERRGSQECQQVAVHRTRIAWVVLPRVAHLVTALHAPDRFLPSSGSGFDFLIGQLADVEVLGRHDVVNKHKSIAHGIAVANVGRSIVERIGRAFQESEDEQIIMLCAVLVAKNLIQRF
jgi:hypothetical protein